MGPSGRKLSLKPKSEVASGMSGDLRNRGGLLAD